MKNPLLFGALAAAFLWSSVGGTVENHDHAAMEGHAAPEASLEASLSSPPGETGAVMAQGEVRKIDAAQGKITLKHGPLAHLGMNSGMTMVFRVQDPVSMSALSVGDEVLFRAERLNGSLVVTAIQRSLK